MLQKKLLVSLAIFFVIAIFVDLYELNVIARNSSFQMEYLDSIHPITEFEEKIDAVKKLAKRKASLKVYSDRLLELKLSFNDSLPWSQIVDESDISIFGKEVKEIPLLNQNSSVELNVIRNKILFVKYLNYLLAKVGNVNGGCFPEIPSIIKDLSNNLSITNYKKRETKISRINNVSNLTFSANGSIRVPLADVINVETTSLEKFYSSENPDFNKRINIYTFDLNLIPDG